MMDSSVPPRPPRGSGTSRDQGLARIRRLTRATVVGVVGGVAVLVGYVAHAVPGHHVSAGAGAASQSSSTGSVSTPATQAPAPSSPATASTPVTQAPAPADTLAPPPTQPQYSRYSPQVISGSS